MPGSIDPHKLAKNQQSLQGKIEVATMERVCKLLANTQGIVNYSMQFSQDTEGYTCIAGKLDCILTQLCQRCLREFTQAITSSFLISPVKNDADAKQLPGEYEPVTLLMDGKLNPVEIIEDELILALPIVPMHPYGAAECIEMAEEPVEDKAQELNNPFQVLQKLNVKKKGQKAEDK